MDWQKKIDALHYEIGDLEEQARNLERLIGIQNHRVDLLHAALLLIRDEHRKARHFEVADRIRDFLLALGLKVEDRSV